MYIQTDLKTRLVKKLVNGCLQILSVITNTYLQFKLKSFRNDALGTTLFQESDVHAASHVCLWYDF